MANSDPYQFDVLAAKDAFEDRDFDNSYWKLIDELGSSLPGIVAIGPDNGGVAVTLEDNIDMELIKDILSDFGARTRERPSPSWIPGPDGQLEKHDYTFLGWYDENGDFVDGLLEPSCEIRTKPLGYDRPSPSTGDVLIEYIKRKYV